MITYKALLGEISAVEAARDSLPSDAHIAALFDLTISRLWEQAGPSIGSRKVSGGVPQCDVTRTGSAGLTRPLT